jgi:hypothetical protein
MASFIGRVRHKIFCLCPARNASAASRSSASPAAPSSRCSPLVNSSGPCAFRQPTMKLTASSRLRTTMLPFSVKRGSNLNSGIARCLHLPIAKSRELAASMFSLTLPSGLASIPSQRSKCRVLNRPGRHEAARQLNKCVWRPA